MKIGPLGMVCYRLLVEPELGTACSWDSSFATRMTTPS